MFRLCAASLLAAAAAATDDIFDDSVFDPVFYLQQNSDLYDADLLTIDALNTHWEDHGLGEGREGSGAWAAMAYAERYDDVATAHGTDYAAMVTEWLDTGMSEGREGYVMGGFEGRHTISKDGLYVSATEDRTTGAVDSIVLDGVQYVNSWYHTFNAALWVQIGTDCYMAESGSITDAYGSTSSAALVSLTSTADALTSETTLAFYNSDSATGCNLPGETVSDVNVRKTVTLDDAIQGAITFETEAEFTSAATTPTFQVPSVGVRYELNVSYAFDVETDTLTDLDGTDKVATPVLLCSPDETRALGVWAEASEAESIEYNVQTAYESVLELTDNKWVTAYANWADQAAGAVIEATAHVCVGSLAEVEDCLLEVSGNGHLISGASMASPSLALGLALAAGALLFG